MRFILIALLIAGGWYYYHNMDHGAIKQGVNEKAQEQNFINKSRHERHKAEQNAMLE